MPRKKSRKSRAKGGSKRGPVSLRSRKHAKNKAHSYPQPPPPQYEDVTQESDLESVASSSASQSKRKRKFSWTLEQEEDLIDCYVKVFKEKT